MCIQLESNLYYYLLNLGVRPAPRLRNVREVRQISPRARAYSDQRGILRARRSFYLPNPPALGRALEAPPRPADT